MEKITVQTNIHADLAKVWAYYTKPEHIIQWNYALENWSCPNVNNDVRVGGKFIARMETKDASEGYYFDGTYTDVVIGERISYVMSNGRHVVVEFDNNGDNNIEVVVVFDSDTEKQPEIQKENWQKILNNFKKHVESI